jgi:transcriptional regulator with XRE-family HTH domain
MGATTIGEALVAKRLDLGLEKGQAAQRIGMSRTTYSSYEQDAQRPSVDVFSALADFLQISLEELLSLYGATCVVAARTALNALASHVDVAPAPSESDSSMTVAISSTPGVPESPIIESSLTDSGENPSEVALLTEEEPVAVEPRAVAHVQPEIDKPMLENFEKVPDKKKKKKKNKKK